MSQYLRDEFIRNISLSEEALRKINDDIVEIAKQVNDANSKQYETNGEEFAKRFIMPAYIIRFDGRGFRIYEFEQAIKYFQEAKRVERFIFLLNSITSMNRLAGKSIDLNFDALDINKSQLIVQDDDRNWVDAAFCKLKERISRYKNKNYIIQNRWVPFIVQIIGVIFGFLLSLWVAIKISPKLAIDNALAFAFVIAFLLFSNIWTLLYEGTLRILNYFWPSIAFKEQGRAHWLIKALISAAFIGMFFSILNQIFLYISQIIRSILR